MDSSHPPTHQRRSIPAPGDKYEQEQPYSGSHGALGDGEKDPTREETAPTFVPKTRVCGRQGWTYLWGIDDSLWFEVQPLRRWET